MTRPAATRHAIGALPRSVRRLVARFGRHAPIRVVVGCDWMAAPLVAYVAKDGLPIRSSGGYR
jgi:hypothetical protein